MMSGLIEARLLQAVVRLRQARRALEVGTFTGPGALAMDEALAPGGSVTTLEADPDNASPARAHIAAHPLGERVSSIVGDARQLLSELAGPALEDGDPVGAFNDVIQTDARVENALLTIGDGVLLVWP
jgi:predicted O-methyltransferase YrrM